MSNGRMVSMDIHPPVSSSECKRGCCYTPFTVCAMSRQCHCHRPTPWQDIIAARTRAEAYLTELMQLPDEDY